MELLRIERAIILAFKIASVFFGVLFFLLSLSYLLGGLLTSANIKNYGLEVVLSLLASFSGVISGLVLITLLPESLRVRFKRPSIKGIPRPAYGFGTLVAVGIGATFGSPLFIVLPENIVEYTVVSVGSMIIASVLSILMAMVYSNMYKYSRSKGMEVVGGPAFTRIATGKSSVRYFVSRFSIWLANTALAAFSAIFFVIFVIQIIPTILSSYGAGAFLANIVVYVVIGFFVVWFIINAFFESRFLKQIGYAQIFFIIIILALLISESLVLGFSGSWNFSGFTLDLKGNYYLDLVVNTGYLFILFFGFQEIQAMDREALDESFIPIYSRVRKGKKMDKATYMGLSMIITVIVAAVVKILFAVSVYTVHPNITELKSSSIPALFVARHYLGIEWETIMAIAFMMATITTFVPAFIAASRHLRSLGEEGFFPHSIASYSWVFTLIIIVILSFTGGSFLINITDFMVLVSLALINLSAIWLKKKKIRDLKLRDFIPIIVGLGCFLAGGSIYFVEPSVVLLGVIAVVLSYLLYDIIHLGTIGIQIFVVIFNLVSFLSISLFSGGEFSHFIPIFNFLGSLGYNGDATIRVVLLGSSALISFNLFIDVFIIRRTKVKI